LHNKAIGCGASGACAPGPDDEDKDKIGKRMAGITSQKAVTTFR